MGNVVVCLVIVVKGSTMNSKLLKVCSAVMLIAGAGNVWSVGGDGGTHSQTNGGSSSPAEIGGATVGVSCKIKASVNVGFKGDNKEVELFDEDGSKKSTEERTYTFSIEKVATNLKLLFLPQSSMDFDSSGADGYMWKIKNEKSDDELSVKLTLISPLGKESVVMDTSRTFEEEYDHTADADEGNCKWKLRFDPQILTSKIKDGSYKGSLFIKVEAAG